MHAYEHEGSAGTSLKEASTLQLRILRRIKVADDVIQLDLERSDRQPLPPWTPGSHINVRITDDLERQYSLCGNANDKYTWSITVQRDRNSRGGSEWIHRNAIPGMQLEVTHMRNNFQFDKAENYILIAGGIGITPLLSMVDSLRESGANWRMLYGGRSRESMASIEALEKFPEVEVRPETEHGRPDLKAFLGAPGKDTLIYACGPVGMLEALKEMTADAGWSAGALRTEQFTGTNSNDDGHEFSVELARSEKVLSVASDATILQTVRDAGVAAMSSCEEGTCGTCETRVLAGIPEHRDAVLSQEDRDSNQYVMICVSRCLGDRLVLDL